MGNRVTELLKAKRRQVRHLALVLVLALLVAAGVGGIFHLPAIAKTYQKTVLACTAVPPTGPGYAGFFVHVHNDDCFDENGNQVCPLPEIKPHVHDASCYTTTAVLVCTLPESDGHQHTEDCYTLVKGDLICEESTEPVYNVDGAIIAEGHVHTDECFEWNKELSCGMEEGEGAHHHDDSCFEYVTTLTCDRPEIILHVHTNECYMVDEDENVYLICGLPEVTEHVHGPECFTTIELDDGEPEFVVMTEEPQPAEGGTQEPEADSDVNTEETVETDTETKETAEETPETEETSETDAEIEETVPAVPMPAQSWERTAGGIKVTVEAPEGAFPENTRIAVTPVNGNSLKDAVSDAVNGEILEVQAVDITFFNEEGREIEPAVAIRVTMIPAETQNAEEKANVVHIDLEQQTAEVIAQAEGTETDNTEVVFDAEAFTIYAIVYTVHFEYEVDGETFTSASMPGAEYTSLAEVIRGLGIVAEEEVDTFVSKISTVASTNEDVAVVENTDAGLCVRVLRDGDAQIVITMQDGAQFRVDVVADGETATGNETATVSTVGDLYLPAEAKLEAKALDDAESESAIAAVQAVEESADSTAAAETAYQVFDISLENVEADQYDGFQVEVKLPENVVGRDFRLFHIHDGETTEIELNTLSRPADDTGLEVVSGFTFETKDFSEFVLKYTVDFTYEGRTWSFPGQGSYRLADVLAVLGIEGSIDDAGLTLILGEDHAGALYLTQADGEYYINSDIAFADTYELRVRSGEKIYIITVTDTQTSTVLSDFLKNAVIVGATQDPDTGRYQVESGKEYTIILNFGEDASVQFSNKQPLTYQMPQGIEILTRQENDAIINIVYNGRTYQVNYHYVLDTDGSLTITFDQDDPDFPRLEESTNVSFRFTYVAQFDGSKTEIKFSDVIERDIIFDAPEPGQAYVDKKGEFDETTGKFNYTITVTADGDVTNVNVKDIITGNALSFNNDVAVNVDSSRYTDNHATDGFDYTFATMAEGETITITYSANVNFNMDTDKDGKITVDQTKNTVTVQPDDGDPHNSEFSREINFNTTSKSDGTDGGTTAEGNKILNWTIDYNPLALVPAAGYTVTDVIGASSREYMQYYGAGITVKVYKPNGDLYQTRDIPYTDITDPNDSTWTWTYTIPDTDTTPYHYIISYQTIVDMAKVEAGHVNVTLDNTANGDPGTASVAPKETLGVEKDFSSFSTAEINWVVTLDVPSSGLAQAVVTDTLPTAWFNRANHYDIYKDGSLSITGLHSNEAYDLDASSEDKVKITFYQDADKNITGLQPHEGGRKIIITLTTQVNQQWLDYGYDDPPFEYFRDHVNTVDFNGITDQAIVTFTKPGLEKKGKFQDSRTIQYTVLLKGVFEEPVSVQDTFDTNVLELDPTNTTWNNLCIYGGNQYDQSAGGDRISYSETSDGVVLTANTVPKMENGNYYPYYKIIYYLKLKDGVDLEQLAIANGGTYDLTNKAIWNGYEDEFTYTTTYDFLNKELLNKDDLGISADGTTVNRNAQYQITFNSAKATLNNGEPMEMTDVISANLSVDYSSITIVTDPAGQAVPYSLRGGKDEHGVSDGTTIATYTVPDSTSVVIRYTANVRGTGDQTIINTVSVLDENETVETTTSNGTGDDGKGSIASFKIVKVDGYDANKKLEGVQFKIFPNDPSINFGEDDSGNVREELLLTTDPNGEILLDGALYDFYYYPVCYHVQEVAPLDDYSPISFDYLVTLTDEMSLVDYGAYIYYFSDSMQIKNWPLEGLVVEKQVESSNDDDKEQYYQFRVSILKDDGTVNTSYNEKNGDDQFENGVVEFQLKDKEQKMFWGFKKGTKYKVEEIGANGLAVSVTYKVYDAEGNVTETITESGNAHTGTLTQQNEIITFKNSRTQEGALKLTKAVTVNGEGTNTTAADGDYTFTITDSGTPATVSKTVVITVTNGAAVSATVDGQAVDLVDGFVVISELTPGDYTITETNSTNTNVTLASITGGKSGTANVQNKQVTVTVTAGDTIADAAIATFTNNIDLGSLEITKSIQRNRAIDASATGTFYYAVYNAEYNASANPAQTPVRTGSITVTTNGSGKATESNLPYGTYYVYELTGQGGTPIVSGENGVQKVINDTIYTVTSSGTSATISSAASPGSVALTNNEETTDVSVEKQWKPAIPEKTTITLGLYSGKTTADATTQVTTIVLDGTADTAAENIDNTDPKAGTKQENPGWKAEFKNLPKYAYNATDGVYEIQYVVKETSSPEGYTVSYEGDGTYVITGGTITNTKKPGDLELTKKVAGTGANETKEFEFTIELTAPTGEELAESYIFKKGNADATGITYTRKAAETDPETGDVIAAANTRATVSGINLKHNDVFTIKGLPAGTKYKIKETDYSTEGYSSSIPADGLTGTITGGTTAKESVEVTNTLSAGDLTVEKTLAGNATEATKEFSFKATFEKTGLVGKNGTYKTGTADNIGGATATDITFTEGKAEIMFTLTGGQKAVFTGLPTGTAFTVEETSKDQAGYETTVSSTGGTVNTADKTVTGEISETTAVTVSYVNTKETIPVEAIKIWKSGNTPIAWPEDVESVEFTLYVMIDGIVTEATAISDNAVKAYFAESVINDAVKTVTKDTAGGKASWDNLPKKVLIPAVEADAENGIPAKAAEWKEVVYSVVETKVTFTDPTKEALNTKDAIEAAYHPTAWTATDKTITNTTTTSIHVTKEWQDKDGNTLTGTNIPSGAKVTFTLFANGTELSPSKTVELNGVDETKDNNGNEITPANTDYEGANWTAYFTNLPVYDSDGKVIVYTVQETGTWTGFVLVTTGDGITYPAIDGGKIINKESALSLDILKVDKNNTKISTGATFELVQVNDTLQVDVVADSARRETTDTDGKLTFSSLKVGFYRITEITPPPGYILPIDATFYVKVTETEIKLLIKESGKKPSEWSETQTIDGVVKTFDQNPDTGNAQATVENTSGTALPQTGGIGTSLFTALGGLLTVTAGAVLTMRRSKRKTAEG